MAIRPLRLRLTDMEKACAYLMDARTRPLLLDTESQEETWWAIERAFEILSEASRHLPPEVKARHPDINWRGIADIGNELRHTYQVVDMATPIQIAVDEFPALITVLETERTRSSPP